MGGCQNRINDNDSTIQTTKKPYNISIDKDTYNFIIAEANEKIYFGKLKDADLQIISYSILNFDVQFVGTIQNYMFSNNSVVLSDGKLFFFVTTREQEINTNRFYSIDITTNELNEVYSEKLYQTFNYITEFNGNLFITKGDLIENTITTYVEQFDPLKNKQAIFKEMQANSVEKTGAVILNITSNKNHLFVYYEKYIGSKVKRYVDMYDDKMQPIDTLELKIDNDFFSQPIGLFVATEKFLFMQNYSSASIFISIDDTSQYTLYSMEESLSLAHQYDYKKIPLVFYNRNTTKIYSMSENGELIESKKIEIDNGYVINNITRDNSSIIVWFKHSDDSNKCKTICYDYSDLF